MLHYRNSWSRFTIAFIYLHKQPSEVLIRRCVAFLNSPASLWDQFGDTINGMVRCFLEWHCFLFCKKILALSKSHLYYLYCTENINILYYALRQYFWMHISYTVYGKVPELCLLPFMYYLQESNYGKANLLSVLSQPAGLLPKMTFNLLKGVDWGNVQLHRFSTFFKCNQVATTCLLWNFLALALCSC